MRLELGQKLELFILVNLINVVIMVNAVKSEFYD